MTEAFKNANGFPVPERRDGKKIQKEQEIISIDHLLDKDVDKDMRLISNPISFKFSAAVF